MSEITELLENVAKRQAEFDKAKEALDTVRKELANSPLLASIGLQVRTDADGSTAGAGGARRLNGERKENLKPILAELITKSGMKRTALESSEKVSKYCNGLGFSKVPNLAPVLKEMVEAGTIKTKGEKSKMVYMLK